MERWVYFSILAIKLNPLIQAWYAKNLINSGVLAKETKGWIWEMVKEEETQVPNGLDIEE